MPNKKIPPVEIEEYTNEIEAVYLYGGGVSETDYKLLTAIQHLEARLNQAIETINNATQPKPLKTPNSLTARNLTEIANAAIDALARQQYDYFGRLASRWLSLSSGLDIPNPFTPLIDMAAHHSEITAGLHRCPNCGSDDITAYPAPDWGFQCQNCYWGETYPYPEKTGDNR